MAEVVIVETPGLGDRSYLVHDGRVALVVDAQRDIDRLLAAADREGVRISHVAETHIHNDYVSGGLELARRLGVPYLVAAAEEVAFDRVPVADGDLVCVGDLTVTVLATPGHTPHHVSYLVSSPAGPDAVFTGGSLLYGTVGRTDLVGPADTEVLTRAQYSSARRLGSQLAAEAAVWPTHGFGSFCSSGTSSGAGASTIGMERRHNPALTNQDEDAFVAGLLRGLDAHPSYYAHMAPINRAGPPAINLDFPRALDAGELAAILASSGWVVDLAERRAYARGHLRGSVSIPYGDQFATYLGWLLPWEAPVTLVGDSPGQVADAQRELARIGIDRLYGSAAGPRRMLAGPQDLDAYPVATFPELRQRQEAGGGIVVLDVRRNDERARGWLAGSVHIPVHDLLARMAEVPAGQVWIHCAGGFRAGIAASLLAREGLDVVHVDDDWERAARSGLSLVVPNTALSA